MIGLWGQAVLYLVLLLTGGGVGVGLLHGAGGELLGHGPVAGPTTSSEILQHVVQSPVPV